MSPSWASSPRETDRLTDRQSQCDFDFDFDFDLRSFSEESRFEKTASQDISWGAEELNRVESSELTVAE
jgi:hypothetical protein